MKQENKLLTNDSTGELKIKDLEEYAKKTISETLRKVTAKAKLDKLANGGPIKKKTYVRFKEELLETKFDLCTPSLKHAFEMGVLNENNYKDIKIGGLLALERYSTTPEGIKNCYNKIKDLSNDKKIIIVTNKKNTLFANNDEEIAKTDIDLKKLLNLNNSRLAQEILDTQVEHPLKKIFA